MILLSLIVGAKKLNLGPWVIKPRPSCKPGLNCEVRMKMSHGFPKSLHKLKMPQQNAESLLKEVPYKALCSMFFNRLL